jgi:hypothetical protein
MPRYLIEVPHEANKAACSRAARIFLDTGSHFLTNADWGCYDGVHKAWMIVELPSKEDARAIVPPAFRPQTTIVQLNRFSRPEDEEMKRHHQG